MKTFLLALSEPTTFLCLAAIFVILFAVIAKTLKEMSFFQKKTAIVVALCVSLLCIIGLYQSFFTIDKTHEVVHQGDKIGILPFLLLPYTALALAILLLLLFLFALKFYRGEREIKNFWKVESKIKKEHGIKTNETTLIRK
jgi:protein-S-isoprenylcysteine O-methyltransferase Ste14